MFLDSCFLTSLSSGCFGFRSWTWRSLFRSRAIFSICQLLRCVSLPACNSSIIIKHWTTYKRREPVFTLISVPGWSFSDSKWFFSGLYPNRNLFSTFLKFHKWGKVFVFLPYSDMKSPQNPPPCKHSESFSDFQPVIINLPFTFGIFFQVLVTSYPIPFSFLWKPFLNFLVSDLVSLNLLPCFFITKFNINMYAWGMIFFIIMVYGNASMVWISLFKENSTISFQASSCLLQLLVVGERPCFHMIDVFSTIMSQVIIFL